jgi:hypothetical protein
LKTTSPVMVSAIYESRPPPQAGLSHFATVSREQARSRMNVRKCHRMKTRSSKMLERIGGVYLHRTVRQWAILQSITEVFKSGPVRRAMPSMPDAGSPTGQSWKEVTVNQAKLSSVSLRAMKCRPPQG